MIGITALVTRIARQMVSINAEATETVDITRTGSETKRRILYYPNFPASAS